MQAQIPQQLPRPGPPNLPAPIVNKFKQTQSTGMSEQTLREQLRHCLTRYLFQFDHLLNLIVETCDRSSADQARKPAEADRILREVRTILAIDAEYKSLVRMRKEFAVRNRQIKKLQERLDGLNKSLIDVSTVLSSKQKALYNFLANSRRMQKSLAENPRVTARELLADAQLTAAAASGARTFPSLWPWMPDVDVMTRGIQQEETTEAAVPKVAASSICMDEVETQRSAASIDSRSEDSSED